MKAEANPRLTEDMKRVLNEQRLGFVASVFPDGTPNLSPKGTTTVWDSEASITSRPLQERRWSLWVRFLRRVASLQ